MKKRLLTIITCIVMLAFSGKAWATYVETLDIYSYSVGGTISWTHTYDFSMTAPYSLVTLTIVADDVDGPGNGLNGEQDSVYINGTFLGYLQMLPGYTNWNYQPGPGNALQGVTTSVFDLSPTLLDWTMPVSVTIETLWGAEIETSTLTVQGAPVPEPATLLLLGGGLLGLGYARRKFKR